MLQQQVADSHGLASSCAQTSEKHKIVTEAVDSKACLKAELLGGNCFTDMEIVCCCSVRARHGSVGQGDDVPHHWRHEGQGRSR